MEFDAVKAKVENSIRKLRNRDGFLLDSNTNERTITHKLAEYLGDEFGSYSVDCEYNRHLRGVKTVEIPNDLGNPDWEDTEAKTAFQDIIVHTRDSNLDNLLVIEVKKSSNSVSRELDTARLKSLGRVMEGESFYGYSFGLFLDLSMTKDRPDTLEWYKRGNFELTSHFPELQTPNQSNS
jgi:hypothetical protein